MRKVSGDYISSLCLSLYYTVRAGRPVSEAFELLLETDTRHTAMLESARDALFCGAELSAALEAAGLPELSVFVRAGEQTGRLEETLLSASRDYERRHRFKREVIGAVLHPAIILVLLIVSFFVFAQYVLPVFSELLEDLGGKSTVAEITARLAIPVIMVIIVLAVLAYVFRARLLRLIFFRGSAGLLRSYRCFAETVLLSQSCGMDSLETFRLAGTLLQGGALESQAAGALTLAERGEEFSEIVIKQKLLPEFYTRLLAVGLRSGESESVAVEILQRLDESYELRLDTIIGAVEPVFVIIFMVLAGLLLLGVMMPFIGILSAL